jgi:sugar/nucleoside kinase (ribokinase family)
MPKSYDVIVVGPYNLDLIFTGLPQFPELGKDVVGTGFDMIPGGAYNPAVAMHRLGLKVGWAADFGNDLLSKYVLERVRTEGLDTSLFAYHDKSYRRLTVAASYKEDRAFITYYDPDLGFPAVMKALATASAKVVYVPILYFGNSFDIGIKLIRLKRIKLVMDANSPQDIKLDNPAVRKVIKNIEILLPNAREIREMTGEADLEKAMRQIGKLCPLVVVKDGSHGSYACEKDQIYYASPIQITPLDTTGAGDCFNAGFIKAWLDGRPITDCLRWGNIVGGLSTLARGGTGYVVTEKEVDNWMSIYREKF